MGNGANSISLNYRYYYSTVSSGDEEDALGSLNLQIEENERWKDVHKRTISFCNTLKSITSLYKANLGADHLSKASTFPQFRLDCDATYFYKARKKKLK